MDMVNKDKVAFVTGANGFLGINLCHQLVANNWRVIAFVRENADMKGLPLNEIEIRYGSVTKMESIKNALPRGVDGFFHLAGVTSQWKKDFKRQSEANVLGTRNAIDAAAELNAKRFVHISSIMAFGLQKKIFDESAVSNAFDLSNNYCRTKLKGENLALNAFRSGMDVVIVNPSHIIGPHDRHNHIQLFKAILNDELPGIPPGKGMFCHVEDVCTAILKAWEVGVSGEKYLIGGHYLSFQEVALEIRRQLGKTKIIKVIPAWVFYTLLPFYTMYSWISKREPLLTRGKIMISCSDIHCDDSKAQKVFDMDYKTLEGMVSDTLRWLKREEL